MAVTNILSHHEKWIWKGDYIPRVKKEVEDGNRW
jgi:hypothetical protein